jgi:trimethylamine--corrinoid protein Co-methyltransferase
MTEGFRPYLNILPEPRVESIVDEAYDVLEQVGVAVEHRHAVEMLAGAGARIADDGLRVFIPRELCAQCLQTVPTEFQLFDRDEKSLYKVGGVETAFDPGSAALSLYDYERGEIVSPTTRNVVEFAVLTDQLAAYDYQSTGLIPADIPENLADRFRLFVALVYGKKPVITGTFTLEGFTTMHALLCASRGSADALRERPLAVFDCCPTSPLTWSELTCDALISCAHTGIPAETVSMPLTGATSPVTLAGAIVQHTAESISGIVIHQLAGSGSPLVYGGAPSCFDMRRATTPMGSVETMMIDLSYAQIGKRLGLPVHTYMGLSDAKRPDFQAGFETAMGVVLAALAGINVVSGPGMLNFVGTQSLEKLVLDAEICAMARRLIDGVAFRNPPEALGILRDHAVDKGFLTAEHTRNHFRSEVYFPSDVVDRGSQADWEAAGKPDSTARAHKKVRDLLDGARIEPPTANIVNELESIIVDDARACGTTSLPDWKFLLP